MDFYKKISPFKDFNKVIDNNYFFDVPSDYWLVISDVSGSTKAIQNGKYKQVNMIGASCIAAAMNAIGNSHFPFVFGGDGATLLIHDSQLESVKSQLLTLKKISIFEFDLDLRVGSVSMKELYLLGAQLKVGKYELSHGNYLAQFKGNAIQKAEKLIKGNSDYQYQITDGSKMETIHLESISCRLNPLPSTNGLILSLLIQPQEDILDSDFNQIVSDLLSRLFIETHNSRLKPVTSEKLFWKWNTETRSDELILHGVNKAHWPLKFKRRIFDWFVTFSLKKLVSLGKFNPIKYREEIILNSDYKKFDEVLRMVIDCTHPQADEIEKRLEDLHQQNKIYFGIHKSNEALMTCMVESATENQHIHFIDGADGGYAMAAIQLKSQMYKAK